MHSDSAEEKLLKLIKSSEGARLKQKQESFSVHKPSLTKGPSPAGYISGRPNLFTNLSRWFKALSLESINKLLRLGMALVFLLFIFNYFYSAKNLRDFLKEDSSLEDNSDINSLPRPLAGDFNDYSAALEKKGVFTASGVLASGQNRANSALNSANATANLKLLGVIAGQKPQAIIEDSVEQKSYSVGVGDYFKDFLVEDIGSGKVTLSYKGSRFDLFL